MRRKYLVKLTNGIYKDREGYTYDRKANSYGNIMFYSKEGAYPYRVTVPIEDVEYLERGVN